MDHDRSALPPGASVGDAVIERWLRALPNGCVYQGRMRGEAVLIHEFRPRGVTERAQGATDLRALQDLGNKVAAARRAFLRRAEALGELTTPLVPPALGTVEAHGTGFALWSLERVDSLADRLAGAKGSRLEPTRLLRQLLEGLSALHDARLAAGTLSPATVHLRGDGSPVVPDIVLAGRETLSDSGPVPVEPLPAYTAPERLTGGKPDTPSDMFSVGALGLRLLSGAPPPPAAERRAGASPVGLDLPGDLARVLEACLDLAPKRRPDPRTVLEALDGPRLPASVPNAPRPRAGAGRTGVARIAGGLALAVLVVAGGVVLFPTVRDALRQTWIVDPQGGGHTRTIAEALDRAPSGAVIRLRPGDYTESVTVPRALTLQGDGTDAADVRILSPDDACVVLDAPSIILASLSVARAGDGGDACVEVTAPGAVIRGARVAGTLRVVDGGGAEIRGNALRGAAGSAVIIEAEASGVIADNEIGDTGTSALVLRGDGVVTANRISGTGKAGILLDGAAEARITDNTIENTGHAAIELHAGATAEIAGNRLANSRQAGVFLYGGAGGSIEGNEVTGNRGSGIVIAEGAAPTIIGNQITNNGEHGVFVVQGGAGRIDGNTIDGNRGHGIAISEDSNPAIVDNSFSGNLEPQTRRAPVALRRP